MLEENPENKQWLEQHGFDVDKLVRYLRWNPAEQMRQLEHMEPARKAQYSKQVHAEHRRNLKRMEENLAKVLPVRICVCDSQPRADRYGSCSTSWQPGQRR